MKETAQSSRTTMIRMVAGKPESSLWIEPLRRFHFGVRWDEKADLLKRSNR